MVKTLDVKVRRAYDKPSSQDGARVLVDRLWPRGIKKENAQLSEHLKAVAPSNELRKWYEHDPAKFVEFEQRYREELQGEEAARALEHLKQLSHEGTLTLLTASKRYDISNAEVLKRILCDSA